MDPIQKIVMPLEVKNLFDRSISFFIWDCMALLISDEKDKLWFGAHKDNFYLGIQKPNQFAVTFQNKFK
jgi:hypothetical protein